MRVEDEAGTGQRRKVDNIFNGTKFKVPESLSLEKNLEGWEDEVAWNGCYPKRPRLLQGARYTYVRQDKLLALT